MKLEIRDFEIAPDAFILTTDGLKLSRIETSRLQPQIDLGTWIRSVRAREQLKESIDGSVKVSDDIALVAVGISPLDDLSDLERSSQASYALTFEQEGVACERIATGDRRF